MNIFMIGQDLPSLFHVHPKTGLALTFGPAETLADGSLWLGSIRNIGQAWSIGTEIWFYLLVPFLIRLSNTTLLLFAFVSVALRYFLADHLRLEVYFFFPTQLMLFLVGMLAFRLGAFPLLARREAAIICLISMIIGAVIFGSVGSVDQRHKWFLYALLAITMNSLFSASKDIHADRMIGELSYPIYITHVLVLSIITVLLKHAGFAIPLSSVLLILFVIPISFALNRYVETPINRYREHFSAKRDQVDMICG